MNEKNIILKQILNEELERLNRIEEVYKEESLCLPKGSVVFKEIKGKKYPYLQYRVGSKVKSSYINNPQKLNEIKRGIEKRKEIQSALKRVIGEKKQLLNAIKTLEK